MPCRTSGGASLPGSRSWKRANSLNRYTYSSVLDYNDLPDPAESAEEAAANLEEAVDLLMSVVKELRALEVQD